MITDEMTMRDARATYWDANDFGADGGYAKKWEVVKIGPIPIPIRNVPARVEAIRYHDLHHLVTGYATDLRGEGEISAWEFAGGCGDKWFAWLINAQGLLLGLLHPRAALTAWARGRRSKTLYPGPFDESLLERTVGDVRRELVGAAPTDTKPDAGDWLTFSLAVAFTAAAHFALLGAGLFVAWIGFVWAWQAT